MPVEEAPAPDRNGTAPKATVQAKWWVPLVVGAIGIVVGMPTLLSYLQSRQDRPGSVRGVVSHPPSKSTTVSLDNEKYGRLSLSSSGQFAFKDLRAGIYLLAIAPAGFQEIDTPVVVQAARETFLVIAPPAWIPVTAETPAISSREVLKPGLNSGPRTTGRTNVPLEPAPEDEADKLPPAINRDLPTSEITIHAPNRAAILLDGRDVGTAVFRGDVSHGTHRVTVKLDSLQYEETITVPGRSFVNITMAELKGE